MLKAKAYMLKNEENKGFIDELDAGIKKEVSVSCSSKKATCSICGKDKGSVDANTFRAKNIRAKPPAQFCQISAMRMSSAL